MTVKLFKAREFKSFEEYADFIAQNTAILVDTLNMTNAYLGAVHELASVALIEREKNRPENRGKLWTHGYKICSQNEEDGIIDEIFRRIGVKTKTFIEFGVQSGKECNTAALLLQGWRGLWMEASTQHMFELLKIQEQFKNELTLKEVLVTAENINDLLEGTIKWGEIDLLSIDIDYNDYWIWKAINIKPRVVVIEYNALFPPPISLTVPYDPKFSWKNDSYQGASLEALTKLGHNKGYALVGCNFVGVNAFFVRNDLLDNSFVQPFTAVKHYEPIRYNVRQLLGHGSRVARYQQV